MGTWKSKNRHKYLLQYHIIFVCKYRKKLLVLERISDDIKQLSYEICQKHHVVIKYMETDKDHIHYLIDINRPAADTPWPGNRPGEYYKKKSRGFALAFYSLKILVFHSTS